MIANGNSSTMPLDFQERRVGVFMVVVPIVVGLGMIGIGATVHYRVLFQHLRYPKAFVLGILLQLLIMPPLAWVFTRIFHMSFGEALGTFIQGCSPGGNTSNLMVYWIGGLVDLSVAMTITTTLVSSGTIPLWLFIYERSQQNPPKYEVPYNALIIALVSLLLPIVIGMIIRVKLEKHARFISKVTISLASIAILVLLVIRAVLSSVPWIVSWKLAVVAMLLPFAAFAIGYLVTLIPWFELKSRSRKTIAVETSMQNAQIATAVIELTMGRQRLFYSQAVLFPILYYVFQVGYAVIFIFFYNLAKHKGWIKEEKETVEVNCLTSSNSKAQSNSMNMKEKETESSTSRGAANPAYKIVQSVSANSD